MRSASSDRSPFLQVLSIERSALSASQKVSGTSSSRCSLVSLIEEMTSATARHTQGHWSMFPRRLRRPRSSGLGAPLKLLSAHWRLRAPPTRSACQGQWVRSHGYSRRRPLLLKISLLASWQGLAATKSALLAPVLSCKARFPTTDPFPNISAAIFQSSKSLRFSEMRFTIEASSQLVRFQPATPCVLWVIRLFPLFAR